MNLSDLSRVADNQFPDDVRHLEMKHLNILGLRDDYKLKIGERLRIDWIYMPVLSLCRRKCT